MPAPAGAGGPRRATVPWPACGRSPTTPGCPILDVRQVADLDHARAEIEARRAVAFVELPEAFTRSLLAARQGTGAVPVRIGGDLGSPTYPVVAIMIADGLDRFARQETGRTALLDLTEAPLGASGSRTEFELYVPGVLVFAIGLMMFAAATALAQETEAGTINRLVRAPISAAGLLGGITARAGAGRAGRRAWPRSAQPSCWVSAQPDRSGWRCRSGCSPASR